MFWDDDFDFDDFDDDWNDDDWDDDDRPRKKKSYRKSSKFGKSFSSFLNDYEDDIEDILDDLEDAEDQEDIDAIREDIEDLKEDILDDWDDSWENDWDDIFEVDWDESFWKSKGRRLPLKVSCSPEVKGKVGEMIVANYLSQLPANEYHVFNDVLLEIGNTSCQIDHVVISKCGIFVIETKNYGGTVYGNEYDNYWKQYLGDTRNKFYSPLKQNRRHIQVLEQCIGCSQDSFVPMVVFSRNCYLKVNTTSPVLYADTMLDMIRDHKESIISENDIKKIEERIIGSWNPSYEARLRHKKRYRFHK